MDAAAVDPITILLVAGEGRFEWKGGSLVSVEPTSDEHAKETLFLVSAMSYYAEERDAGQVMPGQYVQRLDEETIRVPDVAFLRRTTSARSSPP